MHSARTLIVAHDPAFLHAATQVLKRDVRVKEIAAVQTGCEALGRVTTWLPDVVLLDSWLPDMSWLEATRRLKFQSHVLKVVLMTIDEVDVYRDAAAAVQLDEVLDKTHFSEEIKVLFDSLIGGDDDVEILSRCL